MNRKSRAYLHTERSIVITLVEGHIERGCRICAHDENVKFPVKCEIAWNDIVYGRCMSQLRALLEMECIWGEE